MGKRWPYLMLGTGLFTSAIMLTVYTTRESSLPASMWAALASNAGCLVIGLVGLDYALRYHRKCMEDALGAHRQRVIEVVHAERVRLEELAEIAARSAVAQVHEFRRGDR